MITIIFLCKANSGEDKCNSPYLPIDYWALIRFIKIARLVARLARGPGREIVVPGRGCSYWASLLSAFRQVGAHLWHRGPVVSKQQRDLNPARHLRASGRWSNHLSYLHCGVGPPIRKHRAFPAPSPRLITQVYHVSCAQTVVILTRLTLTVT